MSIIDRMTNLRKHWENQMQIRPRTKSYPRFGELRHLQKRQSRSQQMLLRSVYVSRKCAVDKAHPLPWPGYHSRILILDLLNLLA